MADKYADILGGTADEKVPVKDKVDPAKGEMTAQDFINHVKYMEMVSTRASEVQRREWDKSWGLYNNAYDFSAKASWQSKNYIPRVNMTVRAATFMVKRALLGPGKPYTIEGRGDFGKQVAYYMDALVKEQLEGANYVTGVTDSLHAGLLSSLMVLKVYPVYVTEDSVYWTDPTPKPVMSVNSPIKTRQYKKLKIRVDPVDPYNVHLDPTGQKKFVIHDITMDLYDLIELAQDKESGYNIDEIMKIQEDYTRQTSSTENPTSQPEYRSGQAPESTEQRRARTVLVQEYWGDVWTTDGKLVCRKCVYAIANKKYLIREPVTNNFPDPCNPPPFIIAPVIRKPFSVWHQNFTGIVSGLQVMMTELMNLMLDANLFSSAKAFEVDIDQVYDPLEFIQGIAPGKTFKKRGGGFSTSPMIREVSIGQVAQQSLAIFQSLDREFQNGCGLNEYAMPTSGGRSRTTATEVDQKSNAATNFMEEIGKTVEETTFEPLVDKVIHYIIEYMISFDDPSTVELFGAEEASKLSILMRNPAFRKAMHSAPIKCKARGLSASMNKLKDLEKLATLAKILQPYPELQAQVDPQKIMRKAIESMSWYPQDVLKEMDAPMRPPPQMISTPMPQMPMNQAGDVGAILGTGSNGMQVPTMGG